MIMQIMNTSSFVILGPQRKRGASGQIKKPPVEATAWCYTGTRYGWIKRVQTPIQFTICSREDTNFSFAWTIENFGRKMENYKNGECLTSDTFKVEVEGAETAWKLECFPNGKQKIGEKLIQYESEFFCNFPHFFQARTPPERFLFFFIQQTLTLSTDNSASPSDLSMKSARE